MVRVALVAVLAMLAPCFVAYMLLFDDDVLRHRPQDGLLNPSGSVAFGCLLRQKVEVIGRLAGQTDCNDGLSRPHDLSQHYDNNKHF
jgi:hypothetical protein